MNAGLSSLDSRITDEDGRPVPRARLVRGWFTIQRAAGTGVELIVRIPGYLTETIPYGTQADAAHAASDIYAAYCADATCTTAEQEMSQ